MNKEYVTARNLKGVGAMLPTIEEAKKELHIAGEMNPYSYPLMKDEFNYVPVTEEEIAIKEYLLKCEEDDYDRLIQICDALATDYGFVILEKRFVDVTRRYGIMETYIRGWDITFQNKEYFEEKMGCSIYDVLPDIGKTALLCPPPWKPI